MTVHELSRDQLEELKNSMFWMEYDEDFPMPEEVEAAEVPEDIEDYVVFREYEDYDFSPDDFWCTAEWPETVEG